MNSPYLPHISCLLGDSWIISALVGGHALTVYAYIVILVIYWQCARRYKSTQHTMVSPIYRWIPVFIFSCALTHALSITTLFWGGFWYYPAATMVIITGLVSAYTAYFVIPLLPRYLAAREDQEHTVNKLVNQLKSNSDMKADWEELAQILTKLDAMGQT